MVAGANAILERTYLMDEAREHGQFMTRIGSKDVNRRELVKRGAAVGLGGSALAAALGGVIGPSRALAQQELRALMQDDPASGTPGGTLLVATIGEPSTLDHHMTTARITASIAFCMYEGLFTYDANYEPIPELAESYSLSEDELTHTITLRQGITFHNGEPMTADDVIASITRWGQISGVGENLFETVDELAKVDDHTIEFRLSTQFGALLTTLAHNTQSPVIYPKSVIDRGSLEPLTEFVGTGPYQMVEWRPDAYIRLARFDGFVPRDEPTDGFGGRKHAYVDQIDFVPVPDEAARVAGLQAGDYHLAPDISNDQFEVLSGTQGIVTEVLPPEGFEWFFLNWRSPLMSNLAMREAVRASLDMMPMLLNGWGDEQFIRLDPGLMMQESPWHTLAGEELYNVYDPELARQKLEEAGYDGTPVRFLTTQEYATRYGESIVAQQLMEEVGITVELLVSDWATVLERRAQPEEWDMFVTNHGPAADPTQLTCVGQMGTYPGWWDSEESLALADQLFSESDFDARYAIWEQIQANFYSEIPAIKLGDVAFGSYRSELIGGWTNLVNPGIPYWNLWITE